MEFEGVVYKKMPEVSGTSAKGAWKKQDVVFEIPSEFSRKICVTFFGDRAEDAAALQEGDAVNVSVNVESREYNGKWYTDVKAWKIMRKSGEGAAFVAPPAGDKTIKSYAKNYSDGSTSASGASGVSGSTSASGASAGSSYSDAPFNESTAPSPADDVDDLPF